MKGVYGSDESTRGTVYSNLLIAARKRHNIYSNLSIRRRISERGHPSSEVTFAPFLRVSGEMGKVVRWEEYLEYAIASKQRGHKRLITEMCEQAILNTALGVGASLRKEVHAIY